MPSAVKPAHNYDCTADCDTQYSVCRRYICLLRPGDPLEDAQGLAYRSNGTGSALGLVGTLCDEHAPDDLCISVLWSVPAKGDVTVCHLSAGSVCMLPVRCNSETVQQSERLQLPEAELMANCDRGFLCTVSAALVVRRGALLFVYWWIALLATHYVTCTILVS
jgi:hypothetical protein